MVRRQPRQPPHAPYDGRQPVVHRPLRGHLRRHPLVLRQPVRLRLLYWQRVNRHLGHYAAGHGHRHQQPTDGHTALRERRRHPQLHHLRGFDLERGCQRVGHLHLERRGHLADHHPQQPRHPQRQPACLGVVQRHRQLPRGTDPRQRQHQRPPVGLRAQQHLLLRLAAHLHDTRHRQRADNLRHRVDTALHHRLRGGTGPRLGVLQRQPQPVGHRQRHAQRRVERPVYQQRRRHHERLYQQPDQHEPCHAQLQPCRRTVPTDLRLALQRRGQLRLHAHTAVSGQRHTRPVAIQHRRPDCADLRADGVDRHHRLPPQRAGDVAGRPPAQLPGGCGRGVQDRHPVVQRQQPGRQPASSHRQLHDRAHHPSRQHPALHYGLRGCRRLRLGVQQRKPQPVGHRQRH